MVSGSTAPNDLVVDAKGGIYVTDSQYPAEDLMQDSPAVYYIKPGGEVIRVIGDVEFPNGVALSPDGSTMYVCDTNQPNLLAYDVNADGTLANRRTFVRLQITDANAEIGKSGADGICVDSAGNIYVATHPGHRHSGLHPGCKVPRQHHPAGGDQQCELWRRRSQDAVCVQHSMVSTRSKERLPACRSQ